MTKKKCISNEITNIVIVFLVGFVIGIFISLMVMNNQVNENSKQLSEITKENQQIEESLLQLKLDVKNIEIRYDTYDAKLNLMKDDIDNINGR